ncbi:MAG: type II toxin-antitoxin system VapC family toxin [Coriobacteriales bacterium]|jgi:predicted nucleic acid-binding protein
MKICFDANVVIDIFSRPNWMAEGLNAYDIANVRGFDSCLPASTLADISYILRRAGLDDETVSKYFEAIFELFDILDVTGADCMRAHRNGMKDYEDAIVAECAARCNVDLIVTRNVRDFASSPVPAMSPHDFAARYTPDGYSYEEAEI